MRDFAKIFNTKHGQVVVMVMGDDNADPVINFYCKPKNLGVSIAALRFKDSEDGWNDADFLFNKLDLEMVDKQTKDLFSIGVNFYDKGSNRALEMTV